MEFWDLFWPVFTGTLAAMAVRGFFKILGEII